jgi:uncharacterized membrane protein
MYIGLLHLHSFLRWIALLAIIAAFVRSLLGLLNKSAYSPLDKKLSLISLISTHIQLLIGFILYFVSPIVSAGLADMGGAMKDPTLRFWTIEHISVMIIAIIFITLGYSLSKRAVNDSDKHKKVALFFGLGLLLILIRIPWPFMEIGQGRGWF